MHQLRSTRLKTWRQKRLLQTLYALLTALLPPQTSLAQMPPALTIDESIWALNSDAPLRKQEVTFYHDNRAAEDPCFAKNARNLLEMYSPEAQSSFLRIGEACDRLFVLFRNDKLVAKFGQMGLDFVGHHESFHLLGQIYRNKIPIEMLIGNRPIISERARSLLKNINEKLGRVGILENLDLRDSFEQLPEADRAGIAFLAGMEWPAEYYAFKVMEARGSAEWARQYSNIRSILGDEVEYSTGVTVGGALDKIFAGRSWQIEVNNGATMLDVLLKATDSGYVKPDRLLVRVQRLDLNIDRRP
jgi:hypothetical protein